MEKEYEVGGIIVLHDSYPAISEEPKPNEIRYDVPFYYHHMGYKYRYYKTIRRFNPAQEVLHLWHYYELVGKDEE